MTAICLAHSSPIAPEVILHDDADRRMGGGIRVAVPVKDPCHTPGVLIGGKHRGGAYHIVAQFPRFDAVVLVARSVQPRDTDVIFHIVVWKRHVISFVGGVNVAAYAVFAKPNTTPTIIIRPVSIATMAMPRCRHVVIIIRPFLVRFPAYCTVCG